MRMVVFALLSATALACATPALAQQPKPSPSPTPQAQTQPQKNFVVDALASDFVRLEERVRKDNVKTGGAKSAADFTRDGVALNRAGKFPEALGAFGSAVAKAPRDFNTWLVYAAGAQAAADAPDADDAYHLRADALAAAYGAYLRANSRADEARALAYLGQLDAKGENWRPALNAYRASLDRDTSNSIQATYDDLLDKHGFHVEAEQIDSDSASPRACFPFSESLAHGVDFTPFIAVSGGDKTAISVEDQQLCVEGLRHGQRYAVVLRQGLPSAVGEKLRKNADYEIYVRDRSAQVRFTGKNYVLPRVGQEGVPIVTVNTPKVSIDVLRVGDRNLLQAVHSSDFLTQIGAYRAKQIVNETGVKVWSGSLDVKSEMNQDVVTAFPVTEAVKKLEPGVYVLVARAGDKAVTAGSPTPEARKKASSDDDAADAPSDDNAADDSNDYDAVATQWFVVSDIGLTAFSGDDGVHVLARSLATATPQSGIEVRLVARNNEVLATKTTGADGHVKFDPGLARGLGGMAPGLVVAGDNGGDYNFLDLGAAPFDLTDRGVKGRDAPKALDAYVFAERGVYRSGETVNLTAILRDAHGAAASGVPLTLVVKRPDGVEYKRAAVADQGLGARAWSVDLLPGVATGTWRAQAYADPKGAALSETTFLVEDYVPERLDVNLKPRDAFARLNQPTTVDVDAKFLYGAPGAGLDVSGEVTLRAVDGGAAPNMPGYVAGLQDEEFESVHNDIEESATTDDKGKASIDVPIPDGKAPRPLEAEIILRVGETGGRAVERVVTLPVRSDTGLIAVKNDFDNLTENATATFDVVALAPDGAKVAKKNLQWSLYRVTNDYQWYRTDGKWGFERVKKSKRIADGHIDVGAADPAKIAATVGWGAHRLDIRADDGSLAPTSVSFDVGWSGDATAETPDLLQVTLDKAGYRDGETMKVAVNSRFDGKATLVIVGDKVEDMKTFDVKTGDNAVSIPVSASWGASAYAVAIAHRPLDQAAKRMPGRALGLAWFGVDQEARKLSVSIDGPDKIEPRRPFAIPVRVGGLAAGEEAYVELAAVDIGILNLTRYEAPSATKFFFGQRLLAMDVRDIYGYLIDGMQGARGAIRSGGDGGASMPGAKPTQEPLSRYSGLVKVGADGVAQVTFDIPAFNGAMRVMAVAWSKTKVGEVSKDVIVRDPVVVQATLPRFLSLGDKSRMHLSIANVEAPAGDYRLDLDVHGPLTIAADALRRNVRLAVNGKADIAVPITAAGVGASSIDLALTGAGVNATQSFNLNIGSGAAELYRRSVRDIPPGASVTLSGDLLNDFVPGTGAVHVAVSDMGAIDVPALLQALDRYPYGCSEQVVSRAMPLLYVNKLAAAELLPIDPRLGDRVKESIARVLTRQDTNGAFGLWAAGGDDDLWLHAYVTDFLTRARENSFDVPQKAFDQALDHLRNAVVNVNDIDDSKADAIAYAAYVLARNGRPVMSDLRYLADTKLDAFSSPLARAQIGAALALLGDRGRARTVFASAGARLAAVPATKFSRADYGSRLRDGAGLLALAAEAGVDRAELIKASAIVEEERARPLYTSTQEDAWMVLAAEALVKTTQGISLTVDGAPHQGPLYQAWNARALDGVSVTIGNAGAAPAKIVISTSGNPSVPEPPAENGYRVEREFYTLAGEKIDASKPLAQTSRFVVALKVTELENAYARLMLVDHLPAGIEIENSDLFDGGSVDELSFLKREVEPSHTEARDDRFIATFDRAGDKNATFTVAYIARAVTPGRYVMPPATIEDMYRPERFGRTASGALEVAEKK